jgi:hypothetical protein
MEITRLSTGDFSQEYGITFKHCKQPSSLKEKGGQKNDRKFGGNQ